MSSYHLNLHKLLCTLQFLNLSGQHIIQGGGRNRRQRQKTLTFISAFKYHLQGLREGFLEYYIVLDESPLAPTCQDGGDSLSPSDGHCLQSAQFPHRAQGQSSAPCWTRGYCWRVPHGFPMDLSFSWFSPHLSFTSLVLIISQKHSRFHSIGVRMEPTVFMVYHPVLHKSSDTFENWQPHTVHYKFRLLVDKIEWYLSIFTLHQVFSILTCIYLRFKF